MADLHEESRRFGALLERAEERGGRLSLDELGQLARLYRLHATRLARLREQGEDPAAIHYLNALCARAHAHLLVPASPDATSSRPTAIGIGDALRGTSRALATAGALMLIGLVIGGTLVARDWRAIHLLFPCASCMGYTPSRLDRLATSAEERAAFLEREEKPAGLNLFFGSALFTHNTRVGLLSFAAGILAGVPTILLMLYNGIVLGAFAAVFLRDPWPVDFLAWILPHGVPELSAIALCGAGGLVLGEAIAMPGRRGRRVAVQEAFRPALLLFAASVPLFMLAALAESFVRESTLGTVPRLAFAAIVTALLVAGLGMLWRLARRTDGDLGWVAELTRPPRVAAPDSGSAPRR